jgi:uncharacterized iron-regulated membrane protein
MTRSAIVRHHRDLGVCAAPLLLLSMATGSLMIFEPIAKVVLAPWGSLGPLAAPEQMRTDTPNDETDWKAIFAAAEARFPQAAPRRLQFPGKPGEPLTLRMRQPFEWTPNGRTYLRFDPTDGRLLSVDDPATGTAAQAAQEKLYPLHAAKVGGWPWKLAITASGLVLALLGTLAVWSFWFRRQADRRKPAVVARRSNPRPPQRPAPTAD